MNNTVNYWIFGISILLLGASLYLNINSIVITNESIVLTFIGILATFIVVSNFAQVTEIRNNTDKKINELESNTQDKISELSVLFENFRTLEANFKKIEKVTYKNSGDASRLLAKVTIDRKKYKASTFHLIKSIVNYNMAGYNSNLINIILESILGYLDDKYWNNDKSKNEFNYEEVLKDVKTFPNEYVQKLMIIDLLEKHFEEEKTRLKENLKK